MSIDFGAGQSYNSRFAIAKNVLRVKA